MLKKDYNGVQWYEKNNGFWSERELTNRSLFLKPEQSAAIINHALTSPDCIVKRVYTRKYHEAKVTA